jgi:hypothetical protein
MAPQDVERPLGFLHKSNRQSINYIIGMRERTARCVRGVKLFIDRFVVKNLSLYGLREQMI